MKAYIVFQGSGDYEAGLIREDGLCIATHVCSHPGFMFGDLWDRRKERKEKWLDLEVDPTPRYIDDFEKEFPAIFDAAYERPATRVAEGGEK